MGMRLAVVTLAALLALAPRAGAATATSLERGLVACANDARAARRLADHGIAQRLVVRDPAKAPDLPRAESSGPATYSDGDAMRAALAGIATLYLVPATEDLDRLDQHRTAVKAAADARVGHIV